jgi:hypothetical protein
VAQEKEEQDYYLALDVWSGVWEDYTEAPEPVRIGLAVSKTTDLQQWQFIPDTAGTIPAEIYEQPSACTDPNFTARVDALPVMVDGKNLYELYPENLDLRGIFPNLIRPLLYEVSGSAYSFNEVKWMEWLGSEYGRGIEWRSALLGGGDVLIPHEQSYWDVNVSIGTGPMPVLGSASGYRRYRHHYPQNSAFGCYLDHGYFSTVGVCDNADLPFSCAGTVQPWPGDGTLGYWSGNPLSPILLVPGDTGGIGMLTMCSTRVQVSRGEGTVKEHVIESGLNAFTNFIRYKHYASQWFSDHCVVFAYTIKNSPPGYLAMTGATVGIVGHNGGKNIATFTGAVTEHYNPSIPHSAVMRRMTIDVGGTEMVVSLNPRLLFACPTAPVAGVAIRESGV